MVNIVQTKQTSKATSEIVNPILIDETTTTRRVLLATIVDNQKDPAACISGSIVHQRKTPKGTWEEIDAIKLNALKAGEGVQMQFSCSQMVKLREAIEKAYTVGRAGVAPSGKYVFGKEDEVIIVEGQENRYIRNLLEKGLGEDVWKELVETYPDLATKLSLARIQTTRKAVIEQLELALRDDHSEGYWQKILSENDWIFGYGLQYNIVSVISEQVYVGGKNVNNRGGQICDFMAASGGNARFVTLVEIKRPNTKLLTDEDRNGCHPISKDLATAVSQIQGYCLSWGANPTEGKSEFEYDNNVVTVQPKGIIVIGNSAELQTKQQKRSFELFRRNIHNPEIITYDELLARAKNIVSLEVSEESQTPDMDEDDLPF